MSVKVLVTGSSGHLGEALVRRFLERGYEALGVDLLPSPYTSHVGSILDRTLMNQLLQSADAVVHAATLHKPHVATHTKQQFIDVNVSGTQVLLEAAIKQNVKAFLFTSTTSTFGEALSPGAHEAVWVTESLTPIPRNIYGVTKLAAEDLCQLAQKEHGLPCLVLKTSRFFPEEDDRKDLFPGYSQDNLKAIEFLNRRVDLQDAVTAHELALERARELKFDKFIISSTPPFKREDCALLLKDAPAVVRKYFPEYEAVFASQNWTLPPSLGRVYSNEHARKTLGWKPLCDFGSVLERVRKNQNVLGELASKIGTKGYHRPLA